MKIKILHITAALLLLCCTFSCGKKGPLKPPASKTEVSTTVLIT